jgi:hypothetical protein
VHVVTRLAQNVNVPLTCLFMLLMVIWTHNLIDQVLY